MINVVGAGIAGSIVTALLRQHGAKVMVYDCGHPEAASPASSNLFIASWLKKFTNVAVDEGVWVLNQLYGKHIDKPFSSGIAQAMNVQHIAQRHLIVRANIHTRIIHQKHGDFVETTGGKRYPGQATIYCTGAHAPGVTSVKVGHCYHFAGKLKPGQSRLAIVSPYKHEKLYQYDDETIYYADSVTVDPKTYAVRGEELKEQTLRRARKHGNWQVVDFRRGDRPFVDGHDMGYLHEYQPNVWSLTGGGKNGMVAYAYQALQLVKEFQRRGLV